MTTYAEQKKMIEELQRISYRLKGKDKYDFEMFLKRHKDDEDLDSLSMRRLREIYEKYVIKKEK
ncbi:hypothetical protein JGI7_00804 [Candidatus Kryptonium thompsonii]|jgi:hypothetical protein|uniref:Uncharacterized protein n=1 Tax=Candidatus Kryptonium thompsonii TaxID=1633631 RepID=A0A0N7MQU0_9BACT|nr:hypothetical protein [Candidatus Kryptonium thompsoni]CUS79584.1 hypothetical protein JGI13_00437 [Candidatus Kryptonium thompsoni]CUS82779.1 hypothetical protein JGI15_10157 [Candidatus Kryptonium thompsoni]CUS84419.1 hypothetical protein JGI7_00804 [Candidatus Kryptonium thompsoni]CUS85676.1 hypothetical protein JGI10_01159 [Candidatus Kryptonium thompsoni]CUS85706.1 hypothetical protein JGI16_10849 [Candidatus Kryptonium thompsoni]